MRRCAYNYVLCRSSLCEPSEKFLNIQAALCEDVRIIMFCVGVVYVNSQKKPIPLNADFRVVMDDFDLCYRN